MKFKKDFLLELEGVEGVKILETKMIGKSRWSNEFRQVFSFEGKFYETIYSQGTGDEGQRPYEYDDEDIECNEVHPREKTIIEYVRKKC